MRRPWTKRQRLPLGDATALRPPARRTAAVRWALAAAALGALAAAYAASAHVGDATAARSGGRGTVVVLDVSGSITGRASTRIGRILSNEARAAGSDGRVGLVLFSDVAEEALPPRAPSSALGSFRRFFTASGTAEQQPSPWTFSLSGGTRISSGLREARLDLRRAGLAGGRVVLVSDLLDDPLDDPALERELEIYARDPSLELLVRALPASEAGGAPAAQPLGLYRRFLGRSAVMSARAQPPALPTPRRPRHVPLALLALAVVAAVALAANELFAAPLRWRRGAEAAS